MKIKMTLHDIWYELDKLRKERDTYARLATSCVAEEGQKRAEKFIERFTWYEERIEYLSQIEVEFEDKYETGDDEE